MKKELNLIYFRMFGSLIFLKMLSWSSLRPLLEAGQSPYLSIYVGTLTFWGSHNLLWDTLWTWSNHSITRTKQLETAPKPRVYEIIQI